LQAVTSDYAKGRQVMDRKYSVWVGGGEVNDYALDYETALRVAEGWRNDGYDEVQIQEVAQ
jgi:hypothetical protein